MNVALLGGDAAARILNCVVLGKEKSNLPLKSKEEAHRRSDGREVPGTTCDSVNSPTLNKTSFEGQDGALDNPFSSSVAYIATEA